MQTFLVLVNPFQFFSADFGIHSIITNLVNVGAAWKKLILNCSQNSFIVTQWVKIRKSLIFHLLRERSELHILRYFCLHFEKCKQTAETDKIRILQDSTQYQLSRRNCNRSSLRSRKQSLFLPVKLLQYWTAICLIIGILYYLGRDWQLAKEEFQWMQNEPAFFKF